MAPGTVVVFKVKATGDCLQFQWQKECKDLRDGSKYRGTKMDELCIKDVKKSDKGCYRCLVKNYEGEKLSEEAVFTISKLVINVVDNLIIVVFLSKSISVGVKSSLVR